VLHCLDSKLTAICTGTQGTPRQVSSRAAGKVGKARRLHFYGAPQSPELKYCIKTPLKLEVFWARTLRPPFHFVQFQPRHFLLVSLAEQILRIASGHALLKPEMISQRPGTA